MIRPGVQEREPFVAEVADPGVSSIAVSASVLISAGMGGLLGLAIILIAGESRQTDGFLAVYSLYTVFALLGSTLRVTLLPRLTGAETDQQLRDRATALLGPLLSVALVLTGTLAALSPILAPLLSSNLNSSDETVVVGCLAVLALASCGQIAASAYSSTLAAARRFVGSAVVYVAANAVTLATSIALMLVVGILGAAVGILAGAITLTLGHVALLRRHGLVITPRPRALADQSTWRLMAQLGVSASIPLVQQLQLTVGLAAVSTTVGAQTGYTYAYMIAAILYGVTAASVGFVTMPTLNKELARVGRTAAVDYTARTAALAAYVYVAGVGTYAICGQALLETVFGATLAPSTIEFMWNSSLVFLAMGLVWTLLTPVTTAALSLQLLRGLCTIAIATIGGQFVIMRFLGQSSPATIVVCHAILGGAMFAAFIPVVFGRESIPALRHAGRACAPVAALALLFVAPAMVRPPTAVSAVGLAALALCAYLTVGAFAWPTIGRVVLQPLRMPGRRSRRGT